MIIIGYLLYSNVDKSQIYIIDSLAFTEACIEKSIQFQLVDELIYFKFKHTIVLYNGQWPLSMHRLWYYI